MKKHIIYSNWDTDDYREMAVENILINREDEYTDESEIPDDVLYNEIYECMNYTWDDEWSMVKDFFEGKTILVCGQVGTWRGNMDAGKVISIDELYKCWNNCDYLEIYDEGGHFYIRAAHHDGTNYYEVKLLTEKGVEYYDNWENSYTDRRSEQEIHEVLFGNSHYTHIPHFAREVYGCKTR